MADPHRENLSFYPQGTGFRPQGTPMSNVAPIDGCAPDTTRSAALKRRRWEKEIWKGVLHAFLKRRVCAGHRVPSARDTDAERGV